MQGDITEPGVAEHIVGVAREHWGRLDVLVNNAGTTALIPHHDVEAATVDIWRRIFEVNVFGTWAMSVAALPALREAKGCIVNVASVAGVRPTGSSIPYAASKAALNHMTVLLAKVVGPEVRVNAVAPGLIDTPWTEDWEFVREVVQQAAPLRRSGQPDDVAEVILALAQASYVTGQVVVVDGGLSLAMQGPGPRGQEGGATIQRNAAVSPRVRGVTAAVSTSRSRGPATERPSVRRAQPGNTPTAAATTRP